MNVCTDGYKVNKEQNRMFLLDHSFVRSTFLDECRLLTTESPEISPLISEALDALKDRQVLFK